MSPKQYGSGHFGEWIEDVHGLPAYRYTCDQTSDPEAVTSTHPEWREPTDHSHQVGNDRLVAVASNYGYLQVRQDEGSPKFLNDYDPKSNRFAGGFGYLTDGETSLGTFYPSTGASFERIFGVGYFHKRVSHPHYSVDQVIFAPFGDHPVLISQVAITNHRQQPVDLRWVEYWDCQTYQFSYKAMIRSVISRGRNHAVDLRRQAATRFAHQFSVVGGGRGLLNRKRFTGYTLKDRIGWGLAQMILATLGKSFTGGMVKAPVKEASLEDLAPPPTFLVSLDAPADGFATDGQTFFGEGGVAAPAGLSRPLPAGLPGDATGSAMLLERAIHLAPGESKTLYFAYGYLPEGFELDTLLEKFTPHLPGLWARSSKSWQTDRIQLTIPGEAWVDRELTWHNYYLRGNLTYDSFFKEHILSQGQVYQYILGFQGAARDPLQHAMPFTFCYPQVVKEILRYTLKEVKPDGEIPYGLVGHGMVMPAPFKPSDLEMWLLWLASEYILATRDKDFLHEQIPTYPLYGREARKASVEELLVRCYRHLVDITGTGQHGLMRMSNGDWNDAAVLDFVPKDREEDVRQSGESVLNAAFATYTLDLYASMLTFVGEDGLAADARQKAETQRQAVRGQWTGRWFKRQWLTQDLGWIGEDVMWLEPQPWAIIGGSATPEQRKVLVQAIDELMRQPSPIGSMLHSQVIEQMLTAPGDMVNAGVWPSINGTLIWALALVDGEMAWDEWKKNTLAQHAEAYPHVWYGIWSGPDTYNSIFSKYPGHTYFEYPRAEGEQPASVFGAGVNWTDFPVMDMHPHAWPLYTIPKLLGVEFTPQGVTLRPCIPRDEYSFISPLLGLRKTSRGYSGWYSPSQPGEWVIVLALPEEQISRFSHLIVNGEEQPLAQEETGALTWSGRSTPGAPLTWALDESP